MQINLQGTGIPEAFFHGANQAAALDLYERFRKDPATVDDESAAFCRAHRPLFEALLRPRPHADAGKATRATALASAIRRFGYQAAAVDPLASQVPGDSRLEAGDGLTAADLAALPADLIIGGPLARMYGNACQGIAGLRQVYVGGSTAYQFEHTEHEEEREWLRDAAESRRFFEEISGTDKRALLQRLTEAERFEQFLGKTFPAAKRFSIEGTDMLVPMLDQIIQDAASARTHEVVMGMAHRGRLNVLAHILGKPRAAILEEFEHANQEADWSISDGGPPGFSGDVKYHLGYKRSTPAIAITLAPNPSHLEFVNPVVIGRARAAQERRGQAGPPVQDLRASLVIQIHGDAAFPGQGVVAETLNMSRLPGYTVGGSIHIIVNNQIGFTTLPAEGRSTPNASDLAKAFDIPIVRVNADDPFACLAAARMAYAYRKRFGKDFLIDLVGYRRHGHNEADNPFFTQPRMYEIIAKHPTVREILAQQLEKEGVVTGAEAEAMVNSVQKSLEGDLQRVRGGKPGLALQEPTALNDTPAAPVTAVGEDRLRRLNALMLVQPDGFTPHAKLETILERRLTGLDVERGIDWAHAEALAFASILQDGTPIRLTGQDSERGTFGVRHSVLHDSMTGDNHTPLQSIPDARGSFAVFNSPLSEAAVLGFEYGYSVHATESLVLWEAQFGDFANGAQVIIDQFLVSGNAKWQQTSSLVLLLPHGYEGQGPEHSSARLERFLQLAANENIRVCNCTTAAQYFHVLRRQAALLQTMPRPLIVMTPKSLLREPLSGASFAELTQGEFRPVMDDPLARGRADRVTRLVFCSGKVYMDLLKSKTFGQNPGLAVARLEQLCPFPAEEIQKTAAGYPSLREAVWLQEEPANMGAWGFLSTRLREIVGPGITVSFVGRLEAASPDQGSRPRHLAEQSRIIQAVQEDIPAPKGRSKGNGSGGSTRAER